MTASQRPRGKASTVHNILSSSPSLCAAKQSDTLRCHQFTLQGLGVYVHARCCQLVKLHNVFDAQRGSSCWTPNASAYSLHSPFLKNQADLPIQLMATCQSKHVHSPAHLTQISRTTTMTSRAHVFPLAFHWLHLNHVHRTPSIWP